MLGQTIPVPWMIEPLPILLMTRPDASSRRFYDQMPGYLRKRLDLLVSPLIDIEYLNTPIDFGNARGVIFSSAHGVAAASSASDRRDLPVFCVGQATVQAAKDAGWVAQCLGQSAEEVVENLLTSGMRGPLLHLSGCHTRGDISGRLTRSGCPTRKLVVYDQVLCPLSEEARRRINSRELVIAPVFSPRTARQLVSQCPSKAGLHLVALSAAVAEPLSELADATLSIAKEPIADAMVRAVECELNRHCRVESSSGAQ